jgi:hypothetical protein
MRVGRRSVFKAFPGKSCKHFKCEQPNEDRRGEAETTIWFRPADSANSHPPPSRPLAIAESPVSIAALIACFDEALTIGPFKKALPEAAMYVYDNNSTDDTLAATITAGAVVRTETRQGKGNLVRRIFADIEADVFVLADGDGTYEASAAPRLVEKLLLDGLDLVNGARIATGLQAYRPGHQFGNRLLNIVRMIFGRQFNDMPSATRCCPDVLSNLFPQCQMASRRKRNLQCMPSNCAWLARRQTPLMENAQMAQPVSYARSTTARAFCS